MKTHRQNLGGTFTALVTPMNRDGSVDFGALDKLVDWQIDAGIEGLVPCGTTGESATMDAQERASVIERVIARANTRAGNRVTVIAGAGSNDTRAAIEHQRRAKDVGASYSLVATPYYNKPTPEGLYRHYSALREAVDLPIVIYNVPGRTACDMKPATVSRLSSIDGIVAIKEATGDLDRVAAIRKSTPADFAILSGDDPSACALAFMGGDGVISVSSNVVPKQMSEMMRYALQGKVSEARAEHNRLRPLFEALFWESNPIPVKAALVLQKRLQENYRLPLCEMNAELRTKLAEVLKVGGWL
ncbi:MAG: 4-hydroxy-tetrahydrodipicolinate synthase [Myxococcota bacterium]